MRELLTLPPASQPVLVVVVDTEEEFDWHAPFDRNVRSTDNIVQQPLAQAVMDAFGIKPAYVIDHPVATSPEAVRVLRQIAGEGRCEIGAHLHPWVSPPFDEELCERNSFPGNLPAALERDKLAGLCAVIEAAFGAWPQIYKAGRYGIGPHSFRTLAELGLHIDTSIVPHTDFSALGGPDFTNAPTGPFRSEEGILALPLSVHFAGLAAALGPFAYPHIVSRAGLRLRAPALAARLGLLERLRLSPEGHTLADMMRQTRAALTEGVRYFMLTYHSSTLLPGATSYVRDEAARDRFLKTLAGYFAFFFGQCGGISLPVSELAAVLARPRHGVAVQVRA